MKHEFIEGKMVIAENYNEIVKILKDLGYDVCYFNCTHPFVRLTLDGIASGFMDNRAFNEDKLPLITLDTLKQWVEEPKKEVEFKPFDKVLVRDGENEEWEVDMYRKKENNVEGYNHVCFYDCWKICIPYEGNEHLL